MWVLKTALISVVLLLGGRPLQGKRLGSKKKNNREWHRTPVQHSEGTDADHRQLQLNGGAAFIVSKISDNLDWCIDATEGTCQPNSYLGFRPCAFNSGPSEQLWIPVDGKIRSRLDWDTCMVAGDDFLQLAPCDDDTNPNEFVFDGINKKTQIQVKDDPSYCIANGDSTPADDDIMKVLKCENKPKFEFVFRSGYYFLGAGGGLCVAVRNGNISNGNRLVLDECRRDFNAHWRLGGDGLFHSRINDDYCMQAGHNNAPLVHGTPIRLYKCDKNKASQRFEWPDGFEAPIFLSSEPDLFLEPQGSEDDFGASMILASQEREWSGDSVHV